jgi:hypothetical protein
MKQKAKSGQAMQADRRALRPEPAQKVRFTRRQFLKTFSGGIAVAFVLKDAFAFQAAGRRRGRRELPQQIGAWLHISEDNAITVYTGQT